MQQQSLLHFSLQAPAYMQQSPDAASQITTSAKEQLTLIWQQIAGDDSVVPIAPRFPQCMFSPSHRGYTTVTIWVAFSNAAAAAQVKAHLLKQRWADIPISVPQFATAVPAQLHDGDNAIYAVKLLFPQFTDVDISETVQIVNSVSEQLGNMRLLWLGKLSHTGMITSRFSESLGQLHDIPPPPWDLHPSPGLVGLAVSGIPVLTHSAMSPGVQITNSAGDMITLQFRRIPNRAALVSQPRPQPVVPAPAPPASPTPAPAPPVLPAVRQQTAPTPELRQRPVTTPATAQSTHPAGLAHTPTATALHSHPIQQTSVPTRTSLQLVRSPQLSVSSSQPFPVGTWISRPVASSQRKEYGFVLAHILDRPTGAPRHTSPVTFTRVIWADSQYLDVSVQQWAAYTVVTSDRRLTHAAKARVRRKITTAFATPGSELGKYVHALTAHHWSQLGIPKPAPLPALATTSVSAPIVVTTPTPMNTDPATGIRRRRDPTYSPTSQPSRKLVRVNNIPHVQLHRNPFHLL